MRIHLKIIVFRSCLCVVGDPMKVEVLPLQEASMPRQNSEMLIGAYKLCFLQSFVLLS